MYLLVKLSYKLSDEVIEGKFADQFPVDPIQGGAGTSVNMNMQRSVGLTVHS